MADRILYLTDRYKISQGYEPAFQKMLKSCGISRGNVITSDIYNLVQDPLKKYGNESTFKFNMEKKDEIARAFAQRVKTIRPKLIVVSCPAVLGVLVGWDIRIATLDKCRGGVYVYDGITVIVTYPITAIHRQLDTRIVANEDGESDTQEPYRVKQGEQILLWDWQKIGRYYVGKNRKLPPFRYSICRTLEDLYAARDYLADCRLISTDIETGNFPPQVTCVGYAGLHRDGSVHSFVIPLYDSYAEGGTFWDSVDDHAIAWAIIRDINANPAIKTMQNGAYDCAYFIRDLAPTRNYLLDSIILWWSLYMELPKRLDFITSILCDEYQYWKDDLKGSKEESEDKREHSMERYWRYNALDCYYTLMNTRYLVMILLKNPAMQVNYNYAFMRNLSGLAMSMRGMKVNRETLAKHRKELEAERDTQIHKLRYILDDPDFNPNSSDQKKSLLYDFMGARERTARGRFVNHGKPLKGENAVSAGKIPLKMVKHEHPLFKRIIEQMESAMEPDYQISNVCDMADKLRTDRFRTAFNAVGTETERFASKGSAFWDGTNAQNIRKKYRNFMEADPGHIIIDVDYSQSDDVFVAYESQDPDKIDVVESGRDAHAVNGELFFGMAYEEIVAGKKANLPSIVHPIYGIRQLSKRVVHGTNFQMAAMTLYITMGRDAVVAAAELLGHKDAAGWDQDRLVQMCGLLMTKYRRKYKRLTNKEWYKEIAQELKQTGRIVNCFNTTRNFLSDPNDNGTQREATAFIGQSATAGNMNRVMYEIDFGFIPKRFRDGENPDHADMPRRMNWDTHGFALHLQVHDNFVAQLNTGHRSWQHACHNLLHVMDRPVIIKGRTVRIAAEAEFSIQWANGTIGWNGDMDRLEDIVTQIRNPKVKEVC